MLEQLYISNYALIPEARISFKSGFTAITGESGAGKSLMIEALGLVGGDRADFSSIRRGESKSIVEAMFSSLPEHVSNYLENGGLDSFENLILRRELTSSGRSRAFVNDSPVSLNVLKELSEQLFQIHGQHENLAVKSSEFQFEQLDAYSGLRAEFKAYSSAYNQFQEDKNRLESLREASQQVRKDQDYFEFQLDELSALKLDENEFVELEEEFKKLDNVEVLLTATNGAKELLFDDESAVERIRNATKLLNSVSCISKDIEALAERLNSVFIELSDAEDEFDRAIDSLNHDPERKEVLRQKIDEMNRLLSKHGVSDIAGLIEIKSEYELKLSSIESFDQELNDLEKRCTKSEKLAMDLANRLSEYRNSRAVQFQSKVNARLVDLGMPKAAFAVELGKAEELTKTGIDTIEMLFNANDSVDLKRIGDVASGGEIARLMLSLKGVQSSLESDLTMIFDEIDTGVSGEVAKRIGSLMRELSSSAQIISITHSPGVAAKGNQHLKIFKHELNGVVISDFKQLSEDERISELASMFSGNEINDASIESARSLRNQ